MKIARILMWAQFVAAAIAVFAASAAEAPAPAGNELRSLREMVLAHPLDAEARYRLLALRAHEAARRSRALREMADGLAAYCSDSYDEAALHLKAASAAPDVVLQANAALSVSVSELVSRANLKQQEIVPAIVQSFMSFAGKAAYLAEGGVDFDAPGSLACSPRIPE